MIAGLYLALSACNYLSCGIGDVLKGKPQVSLTACCDTFGVWERRVRRYRREAFGLLPDVFCLIVRIFRLMLVLLYI